MHPEQLAEHARSLLIETFGAAGERPDAAFSHGGTGLIGDHTHYFDGFALLSTLPMGAAVALRANPADQSSIIFEGGGEATTFDLSQGPPQDVPIWIRLTADVVRHLAAPGQQIEAAAVSSVPASCVDAYVSSLAVAAARACQSVFARSDGRSELETLVRGVISEDLDVPFGIAHVVAAESAQPESFSLVDARTRERLPVDAPSRDVVGWGLIDVGMGLLRESAFHSERAEQADEATSILKKKGFSTLTSLRELEHRDLHRALEMLPRKLRPIVRHLVTENRRVQKLVVAVRRRDWQMFGALLLMSHASHQKDWDGTNAMVDLVVREAETMSLEGMYGACMTGRGGCVLVVGQPFIVPRCLDRAQAALREQFEIDADVMLL